MHRKVTFVFLYLTLLRCHHSHCSTTGTTIEATYHINVIHSKTKEKIEPSFSLHRACSRVCNALLFGEKNCSLFFSFERSTVSLSPQKDILQPPKRPNLKYKALVRAFSKSQLYTKVRHLPISIILLVFRL